MNFDEVMAYFEDRKFRFLDLASDTDGYRLVGPQGTWVVYMNSQDGNWYLRMLTATTFMMGPKVVAEALT